jgi:hypothetical protein
MDSDSWKLPLSSSSPSPRTGTPRTLASCEEIVARTVRSDPVAGPGRVLQVDVGRGNSTTGGRQAARPLVRPDRRHQREPAHERDPFQTIHDVLDALRGVTEMSRTDTMAGRALCCADSRCGATRAVAERGSSVAYGLHTQAAERWFAYRPIAALRTLGFALAARPDGWQPRARYEPSRARRRPR